MKILTNIQSNNLAGISRVVFSLMDYLKDNRNIDIVGVDILESKNNTKNVKYKNVKFLRKIIKTDNIGDIIRRSKNIEEVAMEFIKIIDYYKNVIKIEKPDIIIINGTYYIPWCLLRAAKSSKCKIVIHYHGILTKETEHWDDESRKKFFQMEKMFINDEYFYIFPSSLTKNTVENIFNKKIINFSVLPNPVPLDFFKYYKIKDINNRVNKIPKLGFVLRWSSIKNIEFIRSFIYYNILNKKYKRRYFEIFIITDKNISDIGLNFKESLKIIKPMDSIGLIKFYKKMDIIFCPSKFETYGNVAMEALSVGTQVLVNNDMGIVEVLRQNNLEKNIINLKKDFIEDVYKKCFILSDTAIDKKTIKFIQEKYSSEIIGERFFNIISEKL